MSFLCKTSLSNLLLVNRRMPSPTYTKNSSMHKSRINTFFPQSAAGRMSPFTSFSMGKLTQGSMTVEASIVLPLLLFFFLHLTGYMEMLRLHGNLSLALWNTGNQLSVYAAVPNSLEIEIPDVAVSYLYVSNSVEKLLGKDYLEASPLVYGEKGLNYLSADYQEDCIDIGVTYQVSPPITIFPFPYMRLVNRYYGKVWTGYDAAGKDAEFVYVTIYGEVWHETADCTYIFITVKEAWQSEINSLRNINGAKYSLCKRCGEKEGGESVYYTEQGTRYHKEEDCAALVRYIRAIEWQEDIPYRPCSRCVGQKE